jgi:hypothetical protein
MGNSDLDMEMPNHIISMNKVIDIADAKETCLALHMSEAGAIATASQRP